MNNNKINNSTLRSDLKSIVENGTNFTKGTVSGFSIEFMEGNSMSSLTYYNDEKGRDEDFETLTELLTNK